MTPGGGWGGTGKKSKIPFLVGLAGHNSKRVVKDLGRDFRGFRERAMFVPLVVMAAG